ncbi:hypothetical protein BDA99DRAFT_587086 [Phascolomyces articulosus]|uniref:Glycosyl transferase family 1 domain-containing protein n=1 Tax=Phascolomyces articulosus TaxID=60185 RepID=A0AAD5K793_9FUNG|nr:hypothetical protein BDA99DRAFT_587086 [Phascolomyces articulosus]
MSSRRDPCRQSIRRFSETYIPQPIYLGVEIDISDKDPSISNYAISAHDGSYTTDYFSGEICLTKTNKTKTGCIREALSKLCDIIQAFSLAQHYKVHMIACAARNRDTDEDIPTHDTDYHDGPEQPALSYAWSQLDALPVRVKTNGPTLDERASAAVRKSVFWLSPVDFNYCIRMAGLADYRETVSNDTWRVLEEMIKAFKGRNLKISFFSSTPQGGGVALMRHALLRFFNILGIRVHWFVMRPKPEIFRITKQKFHNILQGVASPEIELNEYDKDAFIEWTAENVDRFFSEEKGPIKTSDIFVIDDPQVCGLIPHIRKHAKSKDVKIIFRSHIEIRADLLRDYPAGREARSWGFLWDFIKEADLFIAHPVKNFVPDQIPDEKVALMPACTDPLDGLNKFMSGMTMDYYQRIFNRMCIDQGANEVDWERPYFVQVARFDPSKGIPDCVEAYSRLRKRLDQDPDYDQAYIPQLVLCGHGSIDDPEGAVIYENTHQQANRMTYGTDIIVVRLPPSDQLLNTVLRNARAALQLSVREGFEIKVTEASHKGIPVIAYNAGGIPLQIKNGVNGVMLPIGDVEGVADIMYQLLTDEDFHTRISKSAKTFVTEEYFTVTNAMNWLHLFIELTNNNNSNSNGLLSVKKENDLGNHQKVVDMWRKKYKHNIEATNS